MTAPLAIPAINTDSSLSAIVVAPVQTFAAAHFLTLYLPTTLPTASIGGRYFLARCGAQSEKERAEQWQWYLRKPLFVTSQRSTQVDGMPVGEWRLLIPASTAPAYEWLSQRAVGESINLIGPLGVGYASDPLRRNLLVLADSERIACLLPIIDAALDQGKRVMVLLRGTALLPALMPLLPIAVELRAIDTAPNADIDQNGEWQQQVSQSLRWADALVATLDIPSLPWLIEQVRKQRARMDEGFARVLVEADLACGVGACLACVVPSAGGGLHRACVHGPLMALSKLG